MQFLPEERLEETVISGRRKHGRNHGQHLVSMLNRTSSVYVKTWLQDLAQLFENQSTRQQRFQLSTFLCAGGKLSVKFHNVPAIFR